MANLTKSCRDPEEQYMKVFGSLWRDEELNHAQIHKNVLELFAEFFGQPALAHPMFGQRNIFPQHETFDAQPARISTKFILAVLPIMRCDHPLVIAR